MAIFGPIGRIAIAFGSRISAYSTASFGGNANSGTISGR